MNKEDLKAIPLIFVMIVFLFLLLFVSAGNCADYYVDYSSGSNSSAGTSEATAWQTLDYMDDQAYTGGDNIYLKKGETWREQIVVPSDGTSGSPITFTSYGTGADPIISGADLLTDDGTEWADNGGDVWYSVTAVTPHIVLFDDEPGSEEPFASLDADLEWAYNTTALYIHGTSDPDTSGTKIEAAQRTVVIDTNEKEYLTISGLTLSAGQPEDISNNTLPNGGIFCDGTPSGIIVQDCTIENVVGHGITFSGVADGTIDNCTIDGVYEATPGALTMGDGVFLTGGSTDISITDCVFNTFFGRWAIAVVQAEDVTITNPKIEADLWMGGISLDADGALPLVDDVRISGGFITDVATIANDDVYLFNTYTADASQTVSNFTVSDMTLTSGGGTNAQGVHLTRCDGTNLVSGCVMSNHYMGVQFATGGKATIKNNLIYGPIANGFGIVAAGSTAYGDIIGNLIVGGIRGINLSSITNPIRIYSNVLYEQDQYGIFLDDTDGVILKNNIIASLDSGYMFIKDEHGSLTVNDTSDYNLFWAPNDSISVWASSGVTYHDTLADWQTATSEDANSIYGDPLFRDADGYNFQLRKDFPYGIYIDGYDLDYRGRRIDKLRPTVGAYQFINPSVYEEDEE